MLLRTAHAASLLALVTCALAACQAAPDDDADSASAETASDMKAPIDPALRRDFYHLSQGNEMLPYSLARAATVVGATGEVPFLSPANLERYGFVRDDAGPDGLSVGLSVARAPDTGLVSFGVTCSACHVTELDYVNSAGTRSRLRVDGAGTRVDVPRFFGDLMSAIVDTMKRHPIDYPSNVAKEHARIEAMSAEMGFGAAPDGVTKKFGLGVDIAKYMAMVKAGHADPPETFAASLGLGEPRTTLLTGRLYFLTSALMPAQPDDVEAGPGQSDPNGIAKKRLFAHLGYVGAELAPVSTPPMFLAEKQRWYHYNGSSSSIFDRNLIEAIVTGAPTDAFRGPTALGIDTPSYMTATNVPNLVRLEQAVHALSAPAWPADVARDADLAARGAEVYHDECATCHEARAAGPNGLWDTTLVPASEVRTDAQYLINFRSPVVLPKLGPEGRVLIDLLTDMVTRVKTSWFQDHKTSTADQLKMQGIYDSANNPEGMRGTPGLRDVGASYATRPLDGAWATAPYLHNGSVPTIADLLEPAAARPAKFWVGHRSYDLVRLGIAGGAAQLDGATFLFDTSKPGNSNRGHEFGTNLSPDDKRALLEFLKGLGAGRATPVR